jgi:bifunctional polynucleotide phosphatase/kinase
MEDTVKCKNTNAIEDTIITLPIKNNYTNYAIFDFDWTLVKPKDGRKFPINIDDWQYLRLSVPNIINQYKLTHHIIIVTDQTKLWKIDQIKLVLEDLKLTNDTTVIIGGKTHKPDTSFFIQNFPDFSSLAKNAFYVGDAAGRKDDWSDCDKEFAKKLNIKFMVPEEIFLLEETENTNIQIDIPENKEVIILIGYPGSGKSTIAKNIFEKSGYHIVNGDELKTASKMIKDATNNIDKSIVFDSTAGTKEKRQEYIKFAKNFNLSIRAIWITTSIDISMERNKTRALITGHKIPDIVYYVYRKKFEEPTEDEGFTLIKINS